MSEAFRLMTRGWASSGYLPEALAYGFVVNALLAGLLIGPVLGGLGTRWWSSALRFSPKPSAMRR